MDTGKTLDTIEEISALRHDQPITGPSAWRGDSLQPADWLVPLPAACWDELAEAIARPHDGPVHTLSTDGLALDACRALAQRIRRDYLDAGPGLAVLDRFPVEGLGKPELTRAYWLFASLLSRPVQQTWEGRMLFDVHDIGVGGKMVPGSGIRATLTNLDLNFHNDNCFNTTMPDYVGLLCLHPALRGGVSKAISFHTVHNLLREENPALLERLYQPIWWDRHKEFGPGEPETVANPVFDREGGLPRARFSHYNIRGGYRIRGEEPDAELDAALKRLVALFAEPQLQNRFTLQAGQIQFVNNRVVGHARSDFEDHEDPEQRRHLVRLWLRDSGGVSYPG